MKTYTFNQGRLYLGIAVQTDEKLGQIVLLGEAGRGRRFEKVSLNRRNPAIVVEGNVMETEAVNITLGKGTDKEFSFWTLAAPTGESDLVLVRIKTEGCYTRDTSGRWETIAGNPETLVSAYGAYGDAGRIGNWNDGLVIMRPGDVLKVQCSGGSSKWPPYALAYNDKLAIYGLEDWKILEATKTAEAKLANASADPSALPMVFGQMSTWSWSCGRVTRGIKTKKVPAGLAVVLGEEGRGRKATSVPLIGFTAEKLEETAIVELERKEIPARYHSDKPTVEVTYGFIQSDQPEPAGALLRMDTSWVYTRGTNGKWSSWKGSSLALASGWGAQGTAGYLGSMEDDMIVLHEGDVLYVRPEGGYKTDPYAVFMKDGEIRSELWIDWKIGDAQSDPDFYVAKGTAPWGHVPNEWLGQIVKIRRREESTRLGNEEYSTLEDGEEGELVSISPLTLNLGWDGRDRTEIQPSYDQWVVLQADKQVKVLEGEEQTEREELKAKAEELCAKAKEATEAKFFGALDLDIQKELRKLAEEKGFGLMHTLSDNSRYGKDLGYWISNAERTFARLEEVQCEAESTAAAQSAGEVLRHFEVWHRRGGATGLGDGWVIQPDGTRREPDSNTIPRFKRDGDLKWDLVEIGELALLWHESHYEVTKMPVGGLTSAQSETVRQIETEISATPGIFGLDPELTRLYADRLEAIIAAARPHVRYMPQDIGYFEVANSNGIVLDEREPLMNISTRGLPASKCHGREAVIIKSFPAADGEVEILSFEKWGRMNLALRWLEAPTEESPVAPDTDQAEPEDPLSGDDLADAAKRLRERFNGS